MMGFSTPTRGAYAISRLRLQLYFVSIYSKVYVYGFQWIIGNIGFFLAMIMGIYLVVPLIHPLKITSAYEVIFVE